MAWGRTLKSRDSKVKHMGLTGGGNNSNLSIFAQLGPNANCYFGSATVCLQFVLTRKNGNRSPNAERT